MTTIFTDRILQPGDVIVVYAPSIQAGAQAKIVKKNSLDPAVTAVCVGGIEKLPTPKRHGIIANAHAGYRKFVVKENP